MQDRQLTLASLQQRLAVRCPDDRVAETLRFIASPPNEGPTAATTRLDITMTAEGSYRVAAIDAASWTADALRDHLGRFLWRRILAETTSGALLDGVCFRHQGRRAVALFSSPAARERFVLLLLRMGAMTETDGYLFITMSGVQGVPRNLRFSDLGAGDPGFGPVIRASAQMISWEGRRLYSVDPRRIQTGWAAGSGGVDLALVVQDDGPGLSSIRPADAALALQVLLEGAARLAPVDSRRAMAIHLFTRKLPIWAVNHASDASCTSQLERLFRLADTARGAA